MELTFRAMHRYARIAPRKARYVMDMIRHKPVNEALHILQFSNRRAARFIERVLKSAIANAGEESTRRKIELDVDKLVVTEAIVDESTMFKRYMPRSRGMANPILKRNSHLRVAVAPREDHAADLAAAPAADEERPRRTRGKAAAAAQEAAATAEAEDEASESKNQGEREAAAESQGASETPSDSSETQSEDAKS